MKFILMRQTGRIGQNSLCERIVINTSDASCVIPILSTISRRQVLNFHITSFIRRKKALEMGKCSVVQALVEIEIHFDAPDKTSFASDLHHSHFHKRHDVSTCVTIIIITDSFDDFATRSFEFSYFLFYKT